jgi:co-chaperonin GroES (HSP10)
MAKFIEPWNNFIIVLPEPRRTETDGGIIIPETATDIVQLIWATVIVVSKKVEGIKAGDRIFIPFDIGHVEEMDGIKYRFLDANNEMAIWGIEREDESEHTLKVIK